MEVSLRDWMKEREVLFKRSSVVDGNAVSFKFILYCLVLLVLLKHTDKVSEIFSNIFSYLS